MDIVINSPSDKLKPQVQLEAPKEIKEMTFSPPPESLFDGDSGTITTDNGTNLKEQPKEFSVEKPAIAEDKQAAAAPDSTSKGDKPADKTTPKKDETVIVPK